MVGPTVVQLYGPSGSGKTAALVLAVRRLARSRLSVAVVKHSHHPIDLAGKDTDRFRRSGAEYVLFASDWTTLMGRFDPRPLLHALPVDAVLVEGYRRRALSPWRFRIASPAEASDVAKRIVAAVQSDSRRSAPRVLVGGDRLPAPWRRLVENLMADHGVSRLSLERARRPDGEGALRSLAAASPPRPRTRRRRASGGRAAGGAALERAGTNGGRPTRRRRARATRAA